MNRTTKIKLAAPAIAICLALSSPGSVYAAQEDISAVISAIDSLPNSQDINDSHANQVKTVWDAYQELTTAEKIYISNYEKLQTEYNMLVQSGAIIDEELQTKQEQDKIDSQRENTAVSGQTENQVTDYTFQISKTTPSISIVLRYTLDANGDGRGDVPGRIILTSPKGVTTPVSNASSKLYDETMDVGLTWTSNFLQMDFASATDGKWTISTDIPVTFSAISYAGGQQEFKAEEEPEKVEKESSDDGSGEPEEMEAEKSSGNVFKLVGGLALLVGMFGGLIFGFKKIGSSSDKPKKSTKTKEHKTKEEEVIPEQEPRNLTDEEIIEQMRKEYSERLALENQMLEAEKEMEALNDDDYEDLGEVTQQDIDADETIEEYTEGDTDLLRQKDRPAHMGRTKGRTTFDEDDDPFA